jgi:hypothetical protein
MKRNRSRLARQFQLAQLAPRPSITAGPSPTSTGTSLNRPRRRPRSVSRWPVSDGQAKGIARRRNPQPIRHGIVNQMRSSTHIAVALLAVFLLVRPFDCFANGKFDQKAADCCRKGRCSPSNSDDCCKATVLGGNQFVTSKAPDHSSPVLDVAMVDVPSMTLQLLVTSLVVEVHPPPGSPPDFSLNLPLLI